MESQGVKSMGRTFHHDHHLLHSSKVQEPDATINRAFTLIRSINLLALIYYRFSSCYLLKIFSSPSSSYWVSFLMIFTAELSLSFFFIVHQAFFWRPMSRTVYPERLPAEGDHGELPGIDVFICTADPKKEPIVEVMNTLMSSLCLDYPEDKLTVYLSDDAASPLTLYAVKEASSFARSWVPFCKKYGIKTICPEAYFVTLKHKDDVEDKRDAGFMEEEQNIKSMYKAMKERWERATEGNEEVLSSKHDCLPVIEVIHDYDDKMPRLVYVAREKRRDHPHYFKAGALNVLLRVSGIISNAPYILVLDCDMYCNDPSSARQAMCFNLDPQTNSSLAFVQFPQMFYSLSKNDIYDGQLRTAFKSKWQGMDGVRGPGLSGTAFYLKKQAVLFPSSKQEDIDLHELKNSFGSSNLFIRTLNESYRSSSTAGAIEDQVLLQEEAKILASCAYEKETQWGKQIGFLYHCKLESTFTGYYLHCQGWKSVYIYPQRPSFLGCPTLNMSDKLSQMIKWSSELLRLGLSSLSPLTYGLSRLPPMQNMFYSYIFLAPLSSISILLYATIPQLCFLFGISLFPKVSDPWFSVFAIAFATCFAQHLFDVGGSLRTCWNELRMWLILSVTGNFIGCLDAIKKALGMNRASLTLTNKAVGEDEIEKYEKGEFNIRGAAATLIPLVILVLVNTISFILGVRRMIRDDRYDAMFGQAFLALFPLFVSYPVLKAIVQGIFNRRKACA